MNKVYSIVRNFLSDPILKHQKTYTFEVGKFKGKYFNYNIAIRRTDSKDTTVALATREVIEDLQPSVIILLGICGGVKDVKIGDVVVGKKAYAYEVGKETEHGFVARPEVYQYDRELIDFAHSIAINSKWQSRIDKLQHSPNVVFGPIASGNKVISSTDSIVYKHLKKYFNDTTAVEMEAAGFGEAISKYRSIRAMNIRGVSDLIDGKTKSDADGNQVIAVHHAAAFTFELLYQLDFERYKLIIMNAKELTKKLMTFFTPLLKMEALNQIKAEFQDATNTSILEMWAKVKPIFIEEIEDVRKEPEDEDILNKSIADMQKKLRNTLKENEALKDELEGLIRKSNQKDIDTWVTITDSENVIQDSTIFAGRDFHNGDIIKNKNEANIGVLNGDLSFNN